MKGKAMFKGVGKLPWFDLSIVALVVALCFTAASVFGEEFRQADNAYRRSENAGAITYTPVSDIFLRLDGSPPDDSDDPPGDDERIAAYRKIAGNINDPANANNLAGVFKSLGQLDRQGDVDELAALVSDTRTMIPSSKRAQWEPLYDQINDHIAKLRQRGNYKWSTLQALLRDVAEGISRSLAVYTKEQMEARYVAAVASGEAVSWEVAAVFVDISELDLDIGLIFNLLRCVFEQIGSGGDFNWFGLFQCLLGNLG